MAQPRAEHKSLESQDIPFITHSSHRTWSVDYWATPKFSSSL